MHVHIDTGLDPPTKSGIIDRRNRRIHKQNRISQSSISLCIGRTDFLGLRLVINGVPFLGLLSRNGPLALSKLLRLANSRVRHIGYRGRRWSEKNVGGGGWLSTAGGCWIEV